MLFKPRWWALRKHLVVLWRALRSGRTPWSARLLILGALVYAISPIDLVPDWIPFMGWIDDLILVPFILALANRLVPDDLKHELAMEDGAR